LIFNKISNLQSSEEATKRQQLRKNQRKTLYNIMWHWAGYWTWCSGKRCRV